MPDEMSFPPFSAPVQSVPFDQGQALPQSQFTMLEKEFDLYFDLIHRENERLFTFPKIYAAIFMAYLTYSFFAININLPLAPVILIAYGILGGVFSLTLSTEK